MSKKTAFIIVLGFAAGCVLGLGVAWARFNHGTLGKVLPGMASHDDPLAPPAAGRPQPIASLAEETFDFGDIEVGSTVDHGFRLTNDGAAPLLLRKGGTTCGKCTVSDLPQESLAPRESELIGVSYHARDPGPFRQSATILTNDAVHPRVSLTVSGTVISLLHASPADVVFTRLSTNEPTTAETRLLAFGATPLEVTGHEFLEPDTASHFQVEIAPLAADEVAKAAAKSAVTIKVTALAGLPVGAVRQKLRISTNQPKTAVVEVPIQGNVESDLSIVGAGWNRDSGVLALGAVSQREGVRRQVFVLARGPHRNEVRLKIADSDPPWIMAEIGAPEPSQQGAVVRWPLTVIIPPGSPEANHLGTAQGKLGKLVLDTALTDPMQVRLNLHFLVQE